MSGPLCAQIADPSMMGVPCCLTHAHSVAAIVHVAVCCTVLQCVRVSRLHLCVELKKTSIKIRM